MSSLDFQRVVEALPRLTVDERRRVAERLSVLSSIQSPGLNTASTRDLLLGGDVSDVLSSIVRVVAAESGERTSLFVLQRSQQFKSFQDRARALSTFVAQHAPDRVRRAALLDLGFSLLYKSLRSQGYPTTARTLMSHAHRVPGVVDAAFPGYAASGLLGMVVRAVSEGGRDHGASQQG